MPGETKIEGGKIIEPTREESVVYKQAKEIAALTRELEDLRAFKAEVLRGEKRLLVVEHWKRDGRTGAEVAKSRVRENCEVFVSDDGTHCLVGRNVDSHSFYEAAKTLQEFLGKPLVCLHLPKTMPMRTLKGPSYEPDFGLYEVILPSRNETKETDR